MCIRDSQAGRLDEGLKKLDELLKKNPFNARAYGVKGYIYQAQGKLDQAVESYTQALKIDPNLASAANNLAYILAEQDGDLTAALKWAQTARKREPENPNNADTLGWIYYKTKNYVLARNQLQFAATRQPDNPVIQYHLSMACWKSNRIDEAEKALKQALNSKKDFKERSLAEAALREIAKQKNEKSGA